MKEKEKSTSSYPSLSTISKHNTVQRQVRALYDFEAAEDNELSFKVGDIITVTDDSDPNWWRGQTSSGSGLFPASFITSDLNPVEEPKAKEKEPEPEQPRVIIDESVLLKCIQLLEECDPTGETSDPPELSYFEQMSMAQAPLIDQKLAQIDKQHNMLAQIDINIRDVLANYDSAVQQVQYQIQQGYVSKPINTNYTPIPPQQQAQMMPQTMPQWSVQGSPAILQQPSQSTMPATTMIYNTTVPTFTPNLNVSHQPDVSAMSSMSQTQTSAVPSMSQTQVSAVQGMQYGGVYQPQQ